MTWTITSGMSVVSVCLNCICVVFTFSMCVHSILVCLASVGIIVNVITVGFSESVAFLS